MRQNILHPRSWQRTDWVCVILECTSRAALTQIIYYYDIKIKCED